MTEFNVSSFVAKRCQLRGALLDEQRSLITEMTRLNVEIANRRLIYRVAANFDLISKIHSSRFDTARAWNAIDNPEIFHCAFY